MSKNKTSKRQNIIINIILTILIISFSIGVAILIDEFLNGNKDLVYGVLGVVSALILFLVLIPLALSNY